MAFLLSLCSLGFAALNDVMFKLYARKTRSRGLYVGLIGLVWCVVFGLAGMAGRGLSFDRATLVYGLASGAFGAASNLILIHSLTHLNVGICATIYRLNLAPATLIAFLFLGETVTTFKVLGIAAAVLAVLLLLPGRKAAGHLADKKGYVLLVVVANVLRAGMGLTYKVGISGGADRDSFLALNGLVWLAAGVLYYLVQERKTPHSPAKTLSYGIGSGALVCGIVFFMAAAMKTGEASLVLPISQLSFLGSALIGFACLKEKITVRGGLSLALGVTCIVLMAADTFFK